MKNKEIKEKLGTMRNILVIIAILLKNILMNWIPIVMWNLVIIE
jgi:hypothetical protein